MKTFEEQAQSSTICPACGDSKNVGLTVCWACFKYRDNPYKYSELSLEDWLQEIKEEASWQ